MKNLVVIEGRRHPDWSDDEKAVCKVLKENYPHSLSALGLSRWIRKNPDLKKADKKIVAAAKKLAAGMVIAEDVDGNYCSLTR